MWQEIVAKVLSITDKFLEWWTPKQYVIKLKNELKELEDEKILLRQQICTVKRAQRLMRINGRIYDIQELLKNHATD